ncbi:hypothetical protein GH811_15985 [Acetobacterium malicum]|uniref:Uncharacterized protein n=1 Tax=Acetobacterium malicum TaxID=52692 RepID=A0ABR6Z1V2_9FIRM|nr:hypothetical protein [Acetobacterium malicum]MBC3901117.1 hypothetical protein [Acetobacterium malicum]
MKEVVSYSKKYSNEIEYINEILGNLYKGRIYGFDGNNSKQDGSLQANIIKLTRQLNILLNKIEFEKDSEIDEINEMFKIDCYL